MQNLIIEPSSRENRQFKDLHKTQLSLIHRPCCDGNCKHVLLVTDIFCNVVYELLHITDVNL